MLCVEMYFKPQVIGDFISLFTSKSGGGVPSSIGSATVGCSMPLCSLKPTHLLAILHQNDTIANSRKVSKYIYNREEGGVGFILIIRVSVQGESFIFYVIIQIPYSKCHNTNFHSSFVSCYRKNC